MKKLATYVVLLTALILSSSSLAAAQDATLMNVSIPFEFIVAGKVMPAGKYVLARQPSPNVLALKSFEQNIGAGFIAHRTEEKPATLAPCQLTFRRYGDQYFLASVWSHHSASRYELLRTRQERTAAESLQRLAGTSARPELVAVIAQ